MHVVIQKPEAMTPRIVREAFEFPFNVCGCEAVLGMVDSVNTQALEFDRRLGFEEIARIPNGGLEGDLIVFRMTRAECRWLRAH
jgi:RimJ/RimL family protein N-acetyltransferase